jgi:ligand-binding SRPBCC domain-containing protein
MRPGTRLPPERRPTAGGANALRHALSSTMRFVHESVLRAPVSRVFAFHEAEGALERLTPPWEKTDGGTRLIDEVEYALPLGPIGRLFVGRW